MDSFVEASLEWSALTAADLAQLAELRTAIEYLDDPVEQVGPQELAERFRTGTDPSAEAVVGRDRGGSVVAYAWNLPGIDDEGARVWLDGGVHPAWRHQHIGRRLLEWQLGRAHEWHQQNPLAASLPLWVGRGIDERLAGLAQVFTRAGLAPQRWFLDMHLVLHGQEGDNAALPPVPELHGIQLAPYHPVLCEQVRVAHNEAFADRAGVHEVPEELWRAQMQRPEARPQWSWVAMAGAEVVGYAMNSLNAAGVGQALDEGWTDLFGVRPEWRGHRLGRALLVASMRSFLDAGLPGAGLGVDTDDPAGLVDLLESLGYESEETVVLYGCRFPAVTPAAPSSSQASRLRRRPDR